MSQSGNDDLARNIHDKTDLILEKYQYQAENLIPVLQEIQDEFHYLPKEAMERIVHGLSISEARLCGVISFYYHFSTKQRGKHVICLCNGTACHVKKSPVILDALYEKLGLGPGNITTDDMLFTVETVNCLGACGLTPVMLVDDELHGKVTPESALALIDQIMSGESNQ